MKAELTKYGPISCGIGVDDKFEAYTGGVFSEHKPYAMINHEISVVGWGKTDDDQEYWIGRNSWGTYWGEGGFFRMDMRPNYGLGIDTECSAGVPSFNKAAEETVELI